MTNSLGLYRFRHYMILEQVAMQLSRKLRE